jgi:hypothetical protein
MRSDWGLVLETTTALSGKHTKVHIANAFVRCNHKFYVALLLNYPEFVLGCVNNLSVIEVTHSCKFGHKHRFGVLEYLLGGIALLY